MAKKVPVDDKLGYDVFHTDEGYAHIEINKDYANEEEIRKVVLACPAGLYKYENGEISFGRYDPALDANTVWVARSDGRNQRQLITDPSWFSDWSPDGSRIAFDFADGDAPATDAPATSAPDGPVTLPSDVSGQTAQQETCTIGRPLSDQ